MLLQTAIIREAYNQPLVGHPGISKLKRAIYNYYYQLSQGSNINQYISNYIVYRRLHIPYNKKPGLLHQLAIPDCPWQHIIVDFKKCLKSRASYNIIAIFVDCLGKRLVSILVRNTIIAKQLVPLFLIHVIRHVGIPDSITLDCGPQFILDFWNEFYLQLGIKIQLSIANHLQTDGQTEIVNQYFDQQLQLYINHYQNNWDKWVSIIDYQQASLQYETTQQSPFFIEKGYKSRTSFDQESSVLANSPKEQLNREDAKALIKQLYDLQQLARYNMAIAQERYTKQANKYY